MGKFDPQRQRSAPNIATVSRDQPGDVGGVAAVDEGAEARELRHHVRAAAQVAPSPRARPRGRRRTVSSSMPACCSTKVTLRAGVGKLAARRPSARRRPAGRRRGDSRRAGRRCGCTVRSRAQVGLRGEAVERVLVPVELLPDAPHAREPRQPVQRGARVLHRHVGIGDDRRAASRCRERQRLDASRPRPRPGQAAQLACT